jgi:hypothetical protein
MANCKCKKKKGNCQCGGPIRVPTVYSSNPTSCPSPNPCTSITPMECVCYTGPSIVDLGINTGDSLERVLQILVLAITNPGCIIPPTDCISVLDVDYTNDSCGANALIISWNAVSTAVSYQVEYRVVGAVSWTLAPSVVPPITQTTLGGLVPDTWYEIRVNAVCDVGNCYSLTIRVKTLAA